VNIKTRLLLDSRDPSKWKADMFSLTHKETQAEMFPDIAFVVRHAPTRRVMATFNVITSAFWARFLFMPLYKKVRALTAPHPEYKDKA
jgi:hypothetical protein